MIKPDRLFRVLTFAASAALLLLEGATPARAQATEARKAYDLPADDADRALRRFSGQSGLQVIFPSETVRNVRANGVQGNLTAREALDQMFKGTGLIAVQDAKTGALTVRRDLAKDAPKNAPGPVADSSAAPGPIVKMDGMEVLGSRIRRTETDGPTPVATYGVDAIRATGAMNLADFMRTVPQTYNGVGAGRNSTPDDLNISAGQRTENLIPIPPAAGVSPVLATNAPVQTGSSGVSLRGLGAGSTLVLVDGRRVAQSSERNRGSNSGQGFVDLNTIPLGLVERVEIITDGASAIYGGDAVAGVINIVLKKSWVGTELNGSVKLTEHGGARERQATLTTGAAGFGGKFRGTLAVSYYDRAPLTAAQRSFSKHPDFRARRQGTNPTTGAAVYGSDQRIQWGYPASIQATAATGFVSFPGVRVLLAPAGATSTPAVTAFERRTTNDPGQTGTAIVAQGQRITDPSPWTELVASADRHGLTATGTYEARPGLEVYGTYSFSDSRGHAQTLPVYVANVAVSAANNPFGEAIQFGMLLPQWGQVSQQTKTQSHRVTAGARGRWSETWRWDLGYRHENQHYFSRQRTFNATAFTALANANDPAQRFNPYVDERVPGAPNQSALLAQTALFPTVDGRSKLNSVDLTVNGDVYRIWGGPIRTALGGSYENDISKNVAVAYAGFPVVATTASYRDVRTTRAAYGELHVPVVGAGNRVPLLHRLETNFAGRYESLSDASGRGVPKYGATWSPLRGLLFRGSFSEGYRPPSLTEDRRVTTSTTATVTDPARGNQSYLTTVVTRTNPGLKAETSKNEFYGAVFEPSFVKGLSLQVNYYRTQQRDAIQQLGSTVILNNEALFPGFVVRGTPTAADTAAGFKGPVSTLYSQYVNFGVILNKSVDFGAEYRLPWEQLGRWRLNVNAAKTITQTRQLNIGQPPTNDVGDTYSSPRWNLTSGLYWNKGPWSASSSFSLMSGFRSDRAGITSNIVSNTPWMHLIDLRGSYEFKNGVWRRYGKGLRLGVGVANLTDEKPPFSNNIYGFNAGVYGRWAFGRTFEFSFTQPF
ncbi:MAG: TonB-dependent receptor [Verrucomicrobia bacterium]|nr:TonB-dependent receptor [Verrucomicrobiota bacterium]